MPSRWTPQWDVGHDSSSDDDDFLELPFFNLTQEDEEEHTVPIDIQARHAPSINQDPTKKRSPLPPAPTTHQDNLKRFCRLADGTIILTGDTVKVQRHAILHDYDKKDVFLNVVRIVRHPTKNDISLHGYEVLQEKYLLGRSSDGKEGLSNELAMHFEMFENDNRPQEVQGLLAVPLEGVEAVREVTYTQNPISRRYPRLPGGKLACRWSRTSIISPNGQIYGGELRYLTSNQIPARVRKDSNIRRTYDTPSAPRRRYTFFDICCGAGGASRGADNAGLTVLGGVDVDLLAMRAWEANNPGGMPFCKNGFDFLEEKLYSLVETKVNILHLSLPCQVYSGAHTVEGINDAANVRALEMTKPMIEAFDPEIVIIENTSGLVNMSKNTEYFNKMLRDIRTAGPGYNVRYRILNCADYGLPQERKRLFIIAAKIGVPLPPFPKATHGPVGYPGLKPFVSIGEALENIDLMEDTLRDDPYHQPKQVRKMHRAPYNARTKMLPCIMTGGPQDCCHPSGEREFTPRELGILQSLPLHHQFQGTRAQAVKQIGNMVPPLMEELICRSCARTLEAFHHGFIDAEEDIDDLDATLIAVINDRGIRIPRMMTVAPASVIDIIPTTEHGGIVFLYLDSPRLRDAVQNPFTSWAARRVIAEHPVARPQGTRRNNADRRSRSPQRSSSPQRRRSPRRTRAPASNRTPVVLIRSDSESEATPCPSSRGSRIERPANHPIPSIRRNNDIRNFFPRDALRRAAQDSSDDDSGIEEAFDLRPAQADRRRFFRDIQRRANVRRAGARDDVIMIDDEEEEVHNRTRHHQSRQRPAAGGTSCNDAIMIDDDDYMTVNHSDFSRTMSGSSSGDADSSGSDDSDSTMSMEWIDSESGS